MNFTLRDDTMGQEPAAPRIEWEECPCPLCDSDAWLPHVEAPELATDAEPRWFLVVRCRDCGLCYTNPRPSPGCLSRLFRPDDISPVHIARPRSPRDPLTALLRSLGPGRVLDIGCGAGPFLRRLLSLGCPFTALNTSALIAGRARDEWGMPGLVGTLPHPGLSEESFEIITLGRSLEHAHQPLELLDAARSLLTPGGRLVVAVPNLDSLPFRWFGPAWVGLDLPRRLTHFTPLTLRAMLQRGGFRVQHQRLLRRSSGLRASARRAVRLPAPSVSWLRLLQARPFASLASWIGYLTRQADCVVAVATRE